MATLAFLQRSTLPGLSAYRATGCTESAYEPLPNRILHATRWPRHPIIIKDHVVVDGLPIGALRAVFPDDADYDAHFMDFVRFKGAYPYSYATDEDSAEERARRTEQTQASA